jgi:hypothetical protein
MQTRMSLETGLVIEYERIPVAVPTDLLGNRLRIIRPRRYGAVLLQESLMERLETACIQ